MPIDLTHVYTDRCKIHSSEEGPRIEHETMYTPVVSEWVPCRYSLATATERRRVGVTETDATFTLITALYDILGSPITISEKDEIEVETRNFSVYRAEGLFEVVRVQKPRDITPEELLFYVILRQVREY